MIFFFFFCGMDFKSWESKIKINKKIPYIRTIKTHCYSVILLVKSLINTGEYVHYIWHFVSFPFILKISFTFMPTSPLSSPLYFSSFSLFFGNFSAMVLFCYLLYDSLSDSLDLFFVPLADVSFLCPNSGHFSFPFFICFLSLLLADRWGTGCLALKMLWRGLVPIPPWEQAVPVIVLCK